MRFLVLGLLFFSGLANAVCGLKDAKVVSTHRYHDGWIFVNFDKSINCDCPQKWRLAFKDDSNNMDYVKSMVLVAYSSQVSVNAWAKDNVCSVHGNTAILTTFQLN